MKGFIKSLWERGRKVYPITRSRAVVCEDGKDLEERLSATEQAQSGLSRALKSAKEALAGELAAELLTVSINASEANRAASAAESSVQALQEELASLRSEVEALKNNNSGTDYSALEARVSTLESNVVTPYDDTELRNAIEDLSSNIENCVHRVDLDMLQGDIGALETKVFDALNSLQDWTSELSGNLSSFGVTPWYNPMT